MPGAERVKYSQLRTGNNAENKAGKIRNSKIGDLVQNIGDYDGMNSG